MNLDNEMIFELKSQKAGKQLAFYGTLEIDKILQTVVSFLNTDGGWILVGFDGEKFVPIPALSSEQVKDLKIDIYDKIIPQPLVEVRLIEFHQNRIVYINVMKGSRTPYTYNSKYYIRKGNHNEEAAPDEISVLLRSSAELVSTWEKQTLLNASIDDIDSEQVEFTISEAKKIGRENSLPDNIREFLNYFKLLDGSVLKNGSQVLFGIKPVQFLPQCRIRITIMPFGKTATEYADTKLIEDNLFIAFIKIQNYFKVNLPLASQFSQDNWDRGSIEKYPSDALDEAVVNAMVHRDYGDMAGEVTINIYSEKMEIINSGEISSDIIKGKSTIKPHHSVLRNPTIAHMFFLRGKMEKQGRGLALIKERCIDFGLKPPEWTLQDGYTTLTMFSKKRKPPKEFDLSNRQIAILNIINDRQSINLKEIITNLNENVSDRTIRKELKLLVDNGYILSKGNARQTVYVRILNNK